MIPPQDAELQKYFANKVWESGFPAFVPIIGKVFNPLHSHSVLHAVTLGERRDAARAQMGLEEARAVPHRQAGRGSGAAPGIGSCWGLLSLPPAPIPRRFPGRA